MSRADYRGWSGQQYERCLAINYFSDWPFYYAKLCVKKAIVHEAYQAETEALVGLEAASRLRLRDRGHIPA